MPLGRVGRAHNFSIHSLINPDGRSLVPPDRSSSRHSPAPKPNNSLLSIVPSNSFSSSPSSCSRICTIKQRQCYPVPHCATYSARANNQIERNFYCAQQFMQIKSRHRPRVGAAEAINESKLRFHDRRLRHVPRVCKSIGPSAINILISYLKAERIRLCVSRSGWK